MTDEFVFPGLLTYADDDASVLQAFYVTGRRSFGSLKFKPVDESTLARQDLLETFNAWLWISPVVRKWRRPPELSAERDFAHDTYWLQISARGWFDIQVPLKEHRQWFVELP